MYYVCVLCLWRHHTNVREITTYAVTKFIVVELGKFTNVSIKRENDKGPRNPDTYLIEYNWMDTQKFDIVKSIL